MDKIKVTGGVALKGKIAISGAKNAALPLMAASLLTSGELHLSNVPHLVDISTMANLLIKHGTDFTLDGKARNAQNQSDDIILRSDNINNFEAHYNIVRKMRASVLVLGPLLARFGQARVSLPGGCAIGTRPIDLHLSALEKMGASIELEGGYINAVAKNGLKGADIHFEKVSVGATENILMAACLSAGTTRLSNAAMEPEITDLAECLIKMGADISGVGTSELIIKGKASLNGAKHRVIADRIEAGTYMVAGAITGGEVEITGIKADILTSTIDKLKEAGVDIVIGQDSIKVKRAGSNIKPVSVSTEPYPGFATDMQAQFMALMCIADGTSVINENIFENRFMHVSELMRLGADIAINGHTATIKGNKLKGAEIMATDLRASVSLVLAALVAEGTTIINRVYHIDRGYERIEEKLGMVGAKIERIS